ARADRPLRRRSLARVHAHGRLRHLDGRRPARGGVLRPLRAGDRGALPGPLDRQGRRAGAAQGRRTAVQGLRDLDLPPELRGLGQAALLTDLARQAGSRERRLLRQLVHGRAVSRISVDDARELWLDAPDEELRRLAGEVRARYHDLARATYMVMRIINYTNVCVAQCDYCAFYVLPNQNGGYVLS